ncbi:Stress enhanced protein 1, chloroplastic [Linum perenne]
MTTAAPATAVSAHLSPSLSISARYASPASSTSTLSISRRPSSGFGRIGSSFASGSSSLLTSKAKRVKPAARTSVVSITCEQSSQKGSSVDLWLGRAGMIGFAVAIAVEVSTGKGLLENFGLASPMPTAALAITGVVGVLTAVFIFQSSTKS